MSIPGHLRYTPEHEWVSVDGTTVSVGITEYAAQQLGDVVYISLPATGASVTAGEHVLFVGIRGEEVPAQLTDLPFYRRRH